MGWGEFVVLALAGFLGGFTFLYATDFALFRAEWCAGAQASCVREWIGALSGWAAAVAAAVTVYFLAGQMHQARRQADFTVGDAGPTLAITDPLHIRDASEAFQNRLIFTNWNRNPVVLHEVSLDSAFGQELIEVRVASETVSFSEHVRQAQFEQKRLFVEGWSDRTRPPPQVTLLASIGRRDSEPQPFVRREGARFAVDFTILTSEPAKARIVIYSPYALVL